MELVNGTYSIQGLPVADICKEFGTPLYVYDGAKILEQLKSIESSNLPFTKK